MSNQADEVVLTWTDEFILDLLRNWEKYADVIKDLTYSVVMATISKIAETSEQIAQGYLAAYHKAIAAANAAMEEVDDEIDDSIPPIIVIPTPIPDEVDDEIDDSILPIIVIPTPIPDEADSGILDFLDIFGDIKDGIINGITGWLGKAFEGLFDKLIPLAEVIVSGIADLLLIPLEVIFAKFTDFFFEEE